MAFSFGNLDFGFLLSIAERMAAATETKVDDSIVAFFKLIQTDPLTRGWFESQVEYADSQPPGTLSLVAEPPAEVVEALRQGGVFKTARDAGEIVSTIKDLLPYLIQIVQFVRMFTGK